MFKQKLREAFSIDARSLALTRVLLGAFVLVDLVRRCFDLEAFYTDSGALPRGAFEGAENAYHWSFHALGGSAAFELVLFALTALPAIALILGWRTRIATIVLWVFVISLHNRAEPILISADRVFRLVLFWSVFLPLGERWSLDAKRNGRPADGDTPILSIAGATLLVQVVMIYPLTVFHKLENPHWRDMSMVARMLDVDGITSPFGRLFRPFSTFLAVSTFLTLVVETIVPLVALFALGRVRTAAALTMVVFHLVFLGSALYLGLFPLMMLVAWVPFLPAWFWDEGLARWTAFLNRLDGVVGPKRTTAGPLMITATSLLALLASIDLVHSAPATRRSFSIAGVEAAIDLLRFDATRNWGLFTNVMNNQYFVFAATLRDGTKVDLHRDGPLDWERPRNRSRNNRWWKYELHLSDDSQKYAPNLAFYLASTWLREHPEKPVETLDIALVDRPFGVASDVPLRKFSLWRTEFLGDVGARPKAMPLEVWDIGARVPVTIVVAPSGRIETACASPKAAGAYRCALADRGPTYTGDRAPLRPFTRTDGPPILASGDPGRGLPPRAERTALTCTFEVEGSIPKPDVRWESDGPWFATMRSWSAGTLSECTVDGR